MKIVILPIINFKNRVFSLLLCWLATFSACTTESLIEPSEVGDLQTITFTLDMSGNTDVLNRAQPYTDEFRLDDVHVLLFDWSGYIGRYEGENLVSDSYDIEKKTFNIDVLPGMNYDILIVGNCRTMLQSANLQVGQSRQQVTAALKYQLEGHWGYDDLTIPLSFDPLPIYGEVLNVSVNSNQTFNIPVVRMTARIDVALDPGFNTLQHGSLRSVRLYNSNTQGQIIPNSGTYLSNGMGGFQVYEPSVPLTSTFTPMPLYYKVPDPGEELTYTIYTPEAVRGSTDYLRNTCLVVGIGGKADTGSTSRAGNNDSTYYYRIDFRDEESDQFLPILRNHAYTINIMDIHSPGFPDPDKAYRSEPYKLKYEVIPWHTYNYYDPSIYRLDISQTGVETTLSNEWSEIYISTTHPEGWSAYVSDYPDRIERNPNSSLHLVEELLAFDEDWSTSYWGTTEIEGADSEKPFVFVIYTKEPSWVPRYEYATAYIHIVSGNLTNVITVKRQRVQDWN